MSLGGRRPTPCALALVAAASLAPSARAAPAEKADRIFIRGVVVTEDPARPRAEALAIRGERILAVGSTAQIQRLAEPKTDVVDLKGRLVLPGFQDAHCHLMAGGLSLTAGVSLEGAADVKEIQRRIAAHARSHPDSAWVVGRGWSYAAFPGRLPDKSLLDAVVADRPAWMEGHDGHTAWGNSLALRAAGITRYTPDPPDGTIVKDASGEPTGVFKEGAQVYLTRVVPRPNDGERDRALRSALGRAASLGLTSVQDALFDLDDLPAFEAALGKGELALRVYAALPLERDPAETLARYRDLRDRYRGPRLKFGAVAGVLDGVVDSKTAALLEPYVGGGVGRATFAPEGLHAAVTLYDREGFQVLLDAVGDKAIRLALDAYESAARANATSGRRHRVEHVEVPQPDDIPRFRALGVIASTQALFANPDPGVLEIYAQNLGPERASRALPFKLLDDAGAVQAFGSDWPARSSDVLRGIYCAVTRTTPEGVPAGGWQPHLRISPEAALRHYTRDAAFASFDEGRTGTLAPGMLADLVVLSDDILSPPPERILKARVLLTVLSGGDTYRSREF